MVICCHSLSFVVFVWDYFVNFFASVLKDEIDELIPKISNKNSLLSFPSFRMRGKEKKAENFSLIVFFSSLIFQFGDKDNTKNSTMQYKVLKNLQVLFVRFVKRME